MQSRKNTSKSHCKMLHILSSLSVILRKKYKLSLKKMSHLGHLYQCAIICKKPLNSHGFLNLSKSYKYEQCCISKINAFIVEYKILGFQCALLASFYQNGNLLLPIFVSPPDLKPGLNLGVVKQAASHMHEFSLTIYLN